MLEATTSKKDRHVGGHVGVRITDKDKLEEQMEEAFALTDRLVFIDVRTEHTAHVYPMLDAVAGSMRDMELSKTERTS